MSITFAPTRADGMPCLSCVCTEDCVGGCPACLATLNLSNRNASDLLEWLGYVPEWIGCVRAADLAVRCRRRMWPEQRNIDDAVEPVFTAGFIALGRDAGYLRARTEQLLTVALLAGDQWVSWY